MRLHAEYERYNIFRRPDWRFERVLQLAGRYPTPGRCTRRDDAFVRKARNFAVRWGNLSSDEDRKEMLFWEEPGLYYAYQLHERTSDEPEPAHFLQARLLARQGADEIAHVLSTTPETVEWYERLFFNVSDRLENRDWVTKHVLLPSILRHHQIGGPKVTNDPTDVHDDDTVRNWHLRGVVARPFLDASLKLFAYFGGPFLVDAMIAGFQAGKPLRSGDDMASWLDAQWSQVMRRRSAMAATQFEINKYNVMQLFEIHARIMELERSDDAQDKQRTGFDRHVEAALNEIPWMAGSDAKGALRESGLGAVDEGAAEPRDDELLRIAAGEELATLDDAPKALPAPRKKSETAGKVK